MYSKNTTINQPEVIRKDIDGFKWSASAIVCERPCFYRKGEMYGEYYIAGWVQGEHWKHYSQAL